MNIQRYDLDDETLHYETHAIMRPDNNGDLVKYTDYITEIERYKRALEWPPDNCALMSSFKNGTHYKVILEEDGKTIGEGTTPLEAIENAMKEVQ